MMFDKKEYQKEYMKKKRGGGREQTDPVPERIITPKAEPVDVHPEYTPEWDESKVEAGSNRVLKMAEMVMGGDAYYRKVSVWAQHLRLLCIPDYKRPKCLVKADKRFREIKCEIEAI